MYKTCLIYKISICERLVQRQVQYTQNVNSIKRIGTKHRKTLFSVGKQIHPTIFSEKTYVSQKNRIERTIENADKF